MSVKTPGSVYSDLLPVLVQCFAIILLGYLCGRLKFITPTEVNGLKVFVTSFALPAVAFKSLATLNLGDVNWKFLAAISLTKSIIFGTAVIVTLALSRRSYASAGLYAIACSQSNDFALGYPLISDLYSKSHPTFCHYLYLVAPIQLVVLNPIAFTFIEYGGSETNGSPPLLLRNIASSLGKTFKNPIVFMPVLAVIWNVSTNAAAVPTVCLKVVNALGEAFSASALFLLGISMVGQLGSLQNYAALSPALIVAAKILASPLLLRQLVHVLNVGTSQQETSDFGSLGFLYGMLPTAPSVSVFATQYGLPTGCVSTSVVAGTLLSAPFIFVSAAVAQAALQDFASTIRMAVGYTGAVAAVCSLWLLFVLSPKMRKVSHGTTFCLVLSQFFLAVGGTLCLLTPRTNSLDRLQLVLALSGTFASRIWTALLSVLLAILHWRSLCFVLRIRWLLVVGGFLLSALITAAVTFCLFYGQPDVIPEASFRYGRVTSGVLAVTLAITVTGMIVQQHFRIHTYGYMQLPSSSEDENTCSSCPTLVPDVEDLGDKERNLTACTNGTDFEALPSTSAGPKEGSICGPRFDCSKEQSSECRTVVRDYHQEQQRTADDPHELFRHILLLTLLSVSMLVALAVSLSTPQTDAPTGILHELQFIDILMNYGQGILAFLVFGLDPTYVLNPLTSAVRIIRRLLPVRAEQMLPSHLPNSTRG